MGCPPICNFNGPVVAHAYHNSYSRYLHLRGINFDPYLDDCLMHLLDHLLLIQQRNFTLRLLRQLGWLVNLDKSELVPSHTLTFIGGHFQTDKNLVQIPLDRWDKIQSLIPRELSEPLSLREWQALMGFLTSAQDLTSRGRLQLRPLQRFLQPYIRRADVHQGFCLPPQLHRYLLWWTRPLNVLGGFSLTERPPDYQLFVDASMQSWGAHLHDQTATGLWSGQHQSWHINSLELEAVILAIHHWAHRLRGTCLLVATDKTSVVWYIRKEGSTRSQFLLDQTFRLFQLVDDLHILLRVRHISGCRNILADALSRPDRVAPTKWMLHKEAFTLLSHALGSPTWICLPPAKTINCQCICLQSQIQRLRRWMLSAYHGRDCTRMRFSHQFYYTKFSQKSR
ncbi:uncharacterized protein LOC124268105 [Haliotis rubra]|uniref:uncharacterized protein LOC124268105 n=1 Tax=Haliotis rubra TaxID=36100 RepID=UPI001EE57811|nr:uncharacterized protein LOC124268105 [Haliotis rubra]